MTGNHRNDALADIHLAQRNDHLAEPDLHRRRNDVLAVKS